MEKKNNSFWQEMGKPFVVLAVICLIAAGLLGVLNGLTAPVIEEHANAAAEATRREVLPTATAFDKLDVTEDLAALGVTGIYKDQGNTGYVISAANKGYGGDVTVTVAFDNSGAILNVKVDVPSETKGVGSKLADESYAAKFVGLTGNADNVQLRSGATFTSDAYRNSVNAAFAAFDAVQ